MANQVVPSSFLYHPYNFHEVSNVQTSPHLNSCCWSWGFSSMVEYLLSKYKTLSSVLQSEKLKKKPLYLTLTIAFLL